MEAYEIISKLNLKDVTNSKTGKLYKNYPHIGDKMLTNKYIAKFEAKHGFLCLNGTIFHNMNQFGSLNYEKEIDDHVDKMASELPKVKAVDPFTEK